MLKRLFVVINTECLDYPVCIHESQGVNKTEANVYSDFRFKTKGRGIIEIESCLIVGKAVPQICKGFRETLPWCV